MGQGWPQFLGPEGFPGNVSFSKNVWSAEVSDAQGMSGLCCRLAPKLSPSLPALPPARAAPEPQPTHYPRARTYSPTVTLNVTKLTGVSPTVTRVTLGRLTCVPPHGPCSQAPVLPPEGHASLHLPCWGLSCGFLSWKRNCGHDPLHWARRALGAKRSELSSQPLSEMGIGLPVLLGRELRVRELTRWPHQYQRLQAACHVSVCLQKVLCVSFVFLIFPALPCEVCCAARLTEEESERVPTTVTSPNPERDLHCPPEAS